MTATPVSGYFLRRPRIMTAAAASRARALPPEAGSISGTEARSETEVPMARRATTASLFIIVPLVARGPFQTRIISPEDGVNNYYCLVSGMEPAAGLASIPGFRLFPAPSADHDGCRSQQGEGASTGGRIDLRHRNCQQRHGGTDNKKGEYAEFVHISPLKAQGRSKRILCPQSCVKNYVYRIVDFRIRRRNGSRRNYVPGSSDEKWFAASFPYRSRATFSGDCG